MTAPRPRLLDAYCKAGGATRGYQLAGFHVTGVDIEPQPRYVGDDFHQGDAIEFIRAHGHEFEAIAASPPCQAHSILQHRWGRDYPDLVPQTRAALVATGRPYVIENVMGAPLHEPVMLCGTMFGLKVYRHRLFECSVFLLTPPHAPHRDRMGGSAPGLSPKGFVGVWGHHGRKELASAAMGIDWMTNAELAQAIPPAYTTLIGAALLRHLHHTEADHAAD